ncbi:hypothetical protein D9M69_444160 [compost metagenome]
MGILLTFMFIWNMIGALILIPALSHFLLRTDADRQARTVVDAGSSQSDVKAKAEPEARVLAKA